MNIKFEKDGITKETHKKFTQDLIAVGWSVVGAKTVEAPKGDRLAELKAEADEKGIKYHHKAGVAKLEELLGE